MQILLLGATGRTGKRILQALLAKQYAVRVIVRDADKVKVASPNLQVSVCDVFDQADLAHAAAGCSAIISALNISRTSDFPWSALRTPKTFLSDTMSSVIQVATEARIDRIIVCSAWGVNETRKDIPKWFKWLIDHSNIGAAYLDHGKQERMLVHSGLDYTIVRPVALTNFRTLAPVVVTSGDQPRPSLFISRKAVADFMVDLLANDRYRRNVITISQKHFL